MSTININPSQDLNTKAFKIINRKVGLNLKHAVSYDLLNIKLQDRLQPFLNKLTLKRQYRRMKVKDNIMFHQNIRTYRGIRNKLCLPSRGQRTHTNAKTKKKFKI